MAMAGYDPRAAVDFWQRMAQAGGAGVPEFLSTHPSNETRIRNIQQFIPEALPYYQGASLLELRIRPFVLCAAAIGVKNMCHEPHGSC